ncbi:MAG: hypothetical protein AseanaTS_02030 [Candidatus Pelagadaptatus aseana]|uniref:STAS/SEC14 domain-containing protein n=1 Tax=Candidatus Pelagadaptatus aseana TaxID=3120508 RepID=UPI0039B17F8D
MLDYELLKDEGIIRIQPESPLLARDFAEINELVNRFTSRHGHLKGLLISTEDEPGWEEFSEGVNHLNFSDDSLRIAAVSDAAINQQLQSIASHFSGAEVKRFSSKQAHQALSWVDHDTLQ